MPAAKRSVWACLLPVKSVQTATCAEVIKIGKMFYLQKQFTGEFISVTLLIPPVSMLPELINGSFTLR